MLFNSFQFLIFLPIVFLLYWFALRPTKAQNVLIVMASCVFYGWWDYRFLSLIWATIIVSYVCGRAIGRWQLRAGLICVVNVVVNLSILCYFKYFNFFVDNLKVLFNEFGYQFDWFTLDILLPIGISFYTFQAMGYVVDVKRGDTPAAKDFIAFSAYILFFPQLVAGPIERSRNLLPQFLRRRDFDYAQAVDGMRQILWGFFKKIVIADSCAPAVDAIFGSYQTIDSLNLIWGVVLFSFQIYGDFSGYSDIALGVAKLFGIKLMRNFYYPYFSRDFVEYWRRWHISLNRWFVEYVYIPLGGSRHGKWITRRNIMIIFLLSGLWHGANWTFFAWGVFNGAVIVIGNLFHLNKKRPMVCAPGRLLPSFKDFSQMLGTFVLVLLGRILFRSETISQAWEYLCRIFTEFNGLSLMYGRRLLYIIPFIIIEWLQRDKEYGLVLNDTGVFKVRAVRWAVYWFFFIVIVLSVERQEEFIYFQF